MKKNLRHWFTAAAGAAAAFAVSSCAYDPYYSSVGGSYGSGYYGQGYGYGGSAFSTSLFVGTGDPRWGYDPSCYSYYDYRSRRYYDPYLNGYYPSGYRPPVIYGTPHPHGWRPGRGDCPPPGTVRNVAVVNYRDRESAYRNSNYSWSRQVRQQQVPQYRQQDIRRDAPPQRGTAPWLRQSSDRDFLNPRNRQPSGDFGRQSQPREYSPHLTQPPARQGQGSRLPQTYNTPVVSPPEFESRRNADRSQFIRPDSRPEGRPAFQPRGRGEDQRNGSPGGRARTGQRGEPPTSQKEQRRGYRSLGEG
jgi:hypothetical protein